MQNSFPFSHLILWISAAMSPQSLCPKRDIGDQLIKGNMVGSRGGFFRSDLTVPSTKTAESANSFN